MATSSSTYLAGGWRKKDDAAGSQSDLFMLFMTTVPVSDGEAPEVHDNIKCQAPSQPLSLATAWLMMPDEPLVTIIHSFG